MSASMSRKCPFFNLEDGIVGALTMVDGGEAVTTVKNIRSIPMCVCQKLVYNTIHVPSGMGSRQFGRQLKHHRS